MTEMFCRECQKTKQVSVGMGVMTPSICPECEKKKKAKQKKVRLNYLASLTIEERLAMIEERLYDLGQNGSYYIPPQRF